MKISLSLICSPLLTFAVASSLPAVAQQSASDADKAFLVRAAQVNLYALEASKKAQGSADASDIKDLAWVEARDHEKLAQQIKSLSTAQKVQTDSKLSPEFQQRLERLKASSGRDFDNAYIKDMTLLEEEQEKLLAQEAANGESSDFKAFAAKANQIIQHHLDVLGQAAN